MITRLMITKRTRKKPRGRLMITRLIIVMLMLLMTGLKTA